eukprot:1155348-Pelagomonas_calceolata.AAC.4
MAYAGSAPTSGAGSSQSGQIYPFYVLVETHGSNGAHDREKLDAFLEVSPGLHFFELLLLFCALVGTHGNNDAHDREKLNAETPRKAIFDSN